MHKNKNEIHNNIPKFIFTPFKTSRLIFACFIFFSIILSLIIFYKIIIGKLVFTQEELRNLANFTLNIILIIAAFGFSIFSFTTTKLHPKKDEILFRYIGQNFVLISITICTYIISYCDLPAVVFNMCFCVVLVLLISCVARLLSTIVAYFDIRD